MPVLVVPEQFATLPVSQAELDHLATRSPSPDESGYKCVFPSTHGDGWRVRIKKGGILYSLPKIYRHPRDAAKNVARHYRNEYGADWMKVVRPGYVPPKPEGPILKKREGYGFTIHEQEPGQWVITASVFGKPTLVDRPGSREWFHTPMAAKVYLGMWLRQTYPRLQLSVLLPVEPVEVTKPKRAWPWPIVDDWRRSARIRPGRPGWCRARHVTPAFPQCLN